jgi:GT2 family glycosyltransferase
MRSERFHRVRVLLRLHGEPIGTVEAPLDEGVVAVADLLRGLPEGVVARARAHLETEDVPGVTDLGEALPEAAATCPNLVRPDLAVTVAVCTRERPKSLLRCLDSIRAVDYPGLEVIVVDNAPSTTATESAVAEAATRDARLRYVLEARPGLSQARNRALREARGAVIAFTDDDVTVDDRWVLGLVKGFERDQDVACVAGMVCTASIESEAEAHFDARVPWGADRPAEVFRTSHPPSPLFPYTPSMFGTGANLALRREVVVGLGGFDTALGAGTPSRGGEDIDMFVRLLQGGWAIAYEPSALVWHHHRSELRALRDQLYGYGSGLTAFLAKHLMTPRTRRQVLVRIPWGFRALAGLGAAARSNGSPSVSAHALPRALRLLELRGMVAGPGLYLRGRRHDASSTVSASVDE